MYMVTVSSWTHLEKPVIGVYTFHFLKIASLRASIFSSLSYNPDFMKHLTMTLIVLNSYPEFFFSIYI